jgi:hypothetical protein|tara:strand:- start:872 stop:1300 length:429 start_codon:yes stop_codon:yes gene_type:complete
MPNHCANRIEIQGEAKDVKRVKKFLENKDTDTCFDFNNILPMPKELEGTSSPTEEPNSFKNRRLRKVYGTDNWYDWRILHWGTKWNSYDGKIDNEDEEYIVYTFDTAWSPPEPVIHALREKFEEVDITAFFDEPGMEIAGYY